MERNIDLTEHLDFANHVSLEDMPGYKPYIRPKRFIDLIGPGTIHAEKPFEFIGDTWGIYQGGALERATKSYTNSFCDSITCDCCGKVLFPYYHDTLCEECKDRMNYIEPVALRGV